MRNRKIQRMVKGGEISHAEGQAMAAANALKNIHGKEEAISFFNSERYADPTAYLAVQNIAREQKRVRQGSRPTNHTARYA